MADINTVIQVLLCTSSNRTTYTPAQGEPMWESDTETLYVGDGSTAGGVAVTGGGGESNTGSNIGTGGVGVFSSKSGVTLQFKNINAGSSKISVTDDSGNNEIDIDINESNLTDVVLKSIFDAKGDLLVATADNTPAALTVGANGYELVADSTATEGMVWKAPENSRYPIRYATANSTLNVTTDGVVIGAQSSGDITVTPQTSATFPNDGYGKEFAVMNLSPGGGVVNLDLPSTEIFPNGLGTVKINSGQSFRFAGAYPNVGSGWIMLQALCAGLQARYDTTWASTSFATETAVPFNTTDIESDSAILEHSTTNVSRALLKVIGTYEISYWFAVDSTGGSSYNVDSRIRIDGTTTLPGSEASVGNYQSEDSHVCVGTICYQNTSTSTYMELMLDQNNLTGNANNIVLHFKATV